MGSDSSRFGVCLGTSIHWDPSVPIYVGSSIHWDPSVPISMSIWGHPSVGIHHFPFIWGHPSIRIHQFPFPGPYADIHPLGSISSHFRVCLGTTMHWDPSVPISRSIWGHPLIGIHQFLFCGYMRTLSHWDPVFGTVWGHPSFGIHRFPFIWGHPPTGIRQFPFLGLLGDADPLGSISSHFHVHMGTSIHWDPSVPISGSL